jgi:hypothetical protein
MLMPSGILKVTGLSIEVAKFKSDKNISDESLKTLLDQPLRNKKKDKKKAKAAVEQ